MKKSNYFLALILSTATITAASAAGQDNPSQKSTMEQPSMPEHSAHITAEYVVMGRDFTLSGKEGARTIQLKSASISHKPQDGEPKTFSAKEFIKKWAEGGEFNASNPHATLIWRKGDDEYGMKVTIAKVTGKKGITVTAVSESFEKNHEPISREEFMKAAKEKGKQEVALWVNETHEGAPGVGVETMTTPGAGSDMGGATPGAGGDTMTPPKASPGAGAPTGASPDTMPTPGVGTETPPK